MSEIKPTAEQMDFTERLLDASVLYKDGSMAKLYSVAEELIDIHDREREDALLKRFEDLKAEWTRRADIGFRPTGSQCASDIESLIAQVRKERK